MRKKLQVEASAETGTPVATVPSTCMWDLVEYLSCQRIAVNYQYCGIHFTVSFTKSDRSTAQAILDEWANSPMQLLEVG